MRILGERRRRSAMSARPLAPRIVAVGVVLALWASGASAAPLVQQHLKARRHIDRGLVRLEAARARQVRRLVAERHQVEQRLENLASPAVIRGRWWSAHKHLHRALHDVDARLERYRRFTERVRRDLRRRGAALNAWIATWGVFRRCPVAGPIDVADNFGIIVRLPGVPVHRHMGNDITAATGTPIVAPFAGYATSGQSVLGGLEVRVRGEMGYVYNAHLSALGALGYVHTGQVIGYVGATGDATAPHDHFEWHPYDGVAVDPNALLSVVC